MQTNTRTSLRGMYEKEDGVLAEYLDYCYIDRELGKRTAYNYYNGLRHLAKYLAHERNEMECTVEEVELASVTADKMLSITEQEFLAYINYVLYRKQERKGFVRMRISQIKGFYRWLCKRENVPVPKFVEEAERIRAIEVDSTIVTPSMEQDLYDYFSEHQSIEVCTRNTCILYLMLNCMLSLHDIISLNLSDINIDTIRIPLKNGEYREVTLDEEAKAYIDSYLLERSQPLTAENPFFVSSEKRGRLRPCSVQKMLRVSSRRAFSGKTISATDLQETAIVRSISKIGALKTFERVGIGTRRYFRTTYADNADELKGKLSKS